MSETILIRCDFFPGSGAGHLKRCSVLAAALRDRGVRPVFALDADTGPLPVEVFDAVERIGGAFDEERDARAVVELARRIGAGVVLGDSYRISAQWIAALQAAGLGVVVIDDLGVGGGAALRIDYSPRPRRADGPAIELLGPTYFITDSPRLASRAAPARSVICHAGGAGDFAGAAAIYAAAARVASEIGLEMTWLCPDDAARGWLRSAGLATPSDAVLGWRRGRNDLWAGHDIVVGPASTSLFEVVMQGALPVSFPISATQSSDRGVWLPIGHALHLTADEVAAEDVAEALMRVAVERYDALRAALDGFSAAMDGNGAERVADAIRNLLTGDAPRVDCAVKPPPAIRECDLRDAQDFLAARNAPHVRQLSTDPEHVIAWPEHLRWWLSGGAERFVVEGEGAPEAFFWHRPKTVSGRDYLIGGWFPAGERPAFASAIRLLEWQLEHCAARHPDHIWVATIHKDNRAVLMLNRRYGFVDADPETRAAVPQLFPGTTDDFAVLQRKAQLS